MSSKKIKYLGDEGTSAIIGQIKRRLTNVYNVKGSIVYADQAYINDADTPQEINAVGVWKNVNNVWTQVQEFKPGDVYDVKNDFLTDAASFVEGAGKRVLAGTNIVVVNIGTDAQPVIKFDLFSSALSLSEYQTKALLAPVTIFENETPTVYTGVASLPASEEKIEATITDGMVTIIGGTSSEKGDVYRASVSTNAQDDTVNDIAWIKLGNQETVEGALKLLSEVCPNTPITGAEIDVMFSGN